MSLTFVLNILRVTDRIELYVLVGSKLSSLYPCLKCDGGLLFLPFSFTVSAMFFEGFINESIMDDNINMSIILFNL